MGKYQGRYWSGLGITKLDKLKTLEQAALIATKELVFSERTPFPFTHGRNRRCIISPQGYVAVQLLYCLAVYIFEGDFYLSSTSYLIS
jgi:hypothetical protein